MSCGWLWTARRHAQHLLALDSFTLTVLEAQVEMLEFGPARVRATGCYDDNVSSTNSMLEIDHTSPVPLHEQVAAAIRRAIAEGEARSGERLPPAKDLAAILGVNANTVFRALRTLRDEGLVEFRRGRGVSVTGIAPQRSLVVAKARELVAVARRCGYRPAELAEIIEQVSMELP